MKDWKTTLAGLALAAAHVSINGVGWKQLLVAALIAILGFLAKDAGVAVVLVLVLLFTAPGAMAQTPTVPVPITSTVNFNIGAQAFGLGGTQQATPASDVTLVLNPGFTNKIAKQFSLRSDNLLAPGASLQYYGGGFNWNAPFKFALTSAFAPLSFYTDATVGVDRIVPATGPTQAHVSVMAGGGLKWLTSSGVQITLIEVNWLHTPDAPWGNNAPAYSGGLSYVFGSH
jgi:hypothetical protein